MSLLHELHPQALRIAVNAEFDQLVEAKTPLVFIDRRPVLLSPKDREAIKDFKARMEEGGERISFSDVLTVDIVNHPVVRFSNHRQASKCKYSHFLDHWRQ